jgi:predicted AAA+ superfamily ATPase
VELVKRHAATLANETLDSAPITVISGARQVGKSTLVGQLASRREARIVTLDSAVDRAAAAADPDGFANQYPGGLLAIDEVQRVPDLLLAIKAAADKHRRPGRFLITGSADLLAIRGGQESLAGRAQTINLDGFSRGEIEGRVDDFAAYAWSLSGGKPLRDITDINRHDYLAMAVASTFPELRDASPATARRWLANYVQRVLSKDAAEVSGIQYPDRLRPLLDLLAAENASEFVAAHAARQLDLPARSIPAYVRALRDVFLIRDLPAWGHNLGKRVISRPKIAIGDAGLAAYLTGVNADGLESDISSTLAGGMVEAFVTAELSKQRTWSAVDYRLYHFRDSDGREVDLVAENTRREVVAIEVKATTTLLRRHFTGLEHIRHLAGARFVAGIALYTGSRAVPFGDRLWALPIGALWRA